MWDCRISTWEEKMFTKKFRFSVSVTPPFSVDCRHRPKYVVGPTGVARSDLGFSANLRNKFCKIRKKIQQNTEKNSA